MPVVWVLPAPLSCTMSLLWVSLGERCREIALIVDPQATPIDMLESKYWLRIRAAPRATRSWRSTSEEPPVTGTTCALTPNRRTISRSHRVDISRGERMRMSTSPDSRA